MRHLGVLIDDLVEHFVGHSVDAQHVRKLDAPEVGHFEDGRAHAFVILTRAIWPEAREGPVAHDLRRRLCKHRPRARMEIDEPTQATERALVAVSRAAPRSVLHGLRVQNVLRAALASVSLAGCGRQSETSLLLITLDTVRADRLGSYGSPLGLTPQLDRFARESVRFADVTSQVPLTTPSHASILTGLLPPRHGVRNNESFRLDQSHETLATRLRASGFRTGAFIGAFPLESRFGLARGFDVYDEAFLQKPGIQERRAEEVLAAASGFIRDAAPSGRPFFVWAHLFDAHTPYEAPDAFRERFRSDPYGAEIAYVDDALGRFFESLRAEDLLDRMVVAVVADHGESLGEHGENTHGALLYESTLRVPWLVRLPGGRRGGHEVARPVRTVDVGPTLLGILNRGALPGADGVDLAPAIETGRAVPELAIYSESLYLHLLLGWSELRSLRRGTLKTIDGVAAELFDVAHDPEEKRNLFNSRRTEAAALLRELRALPNEIAGPSPAPTSDAAQRLATLGYASGGTRSSRRKVRDPRDGMAIWREIEAGTTLLQSHRDTARRHFQRALELDPENGLALKSLGDVERANGKTSLALDFYERAAAEGFEHPDLDLARARAELELGRLEAAEKSVDGLLRAQPENADGLLLRASLLRARGKSQDAETLLREAGKRSPSSALIWNELGGALAEQGKKDEAVTAFREAIRLAPDSAEPRRNLALLVSGEEAESLLREALRLRADYPEAHVDLARRLAETGRAREAESEIAAALKLRKDDPETFFVAARVAELNGRTPDARRHYARFLALAPSGLDEPRAIAKRRLAALAGR